MDRILAARLGCHAVEILRKGETDKCVCLKDNKLSKNPQEMAIKQKTLEIESNYRLIKILT